jgi:hypothetical protein
VLLEGTADQCRPGFPAAQLRTVTGGTGAQVWIVLRVRAWAREEQSRSREECDPGYGNGSAHNDRSPSVVFCTSEPAKRTAPAQHAAAAANGEERGRV